MQTTDAPDGAGQLPPSQPGDAVLTTGGARVSCGRERLASHEVRGHARLKLTIPQRCRGGLTVRGGKALLVRGVRGTRLEVVLRGDRFRIVERRGRLRRVRAEARVDGKWRRVNVDAMGRGRLPRHATGLRVSGRIKGGKPASAVAFLSR